MVQVMPVDDEILHSKYFQNGSRLDKFILRKEIMVVVRGAIAKMSKRDKFVVKSLYIDGKSLRETGEKIGIRKLSVASIRDKILNKIRKSLKEAGVAIHDEETRRETDVQLGQKATQASKGIQGGMQNEFSSVSASC